MAVRLLAPWFGFKPGDAVERGPEFDRKAVESGKGERVTMTITPIETKAAARPKEKRNEHI